jgi:ribosomal peptide maturation radical SAM protein 1
MQVCLVQMPYSALERPSISLSLLNAYLASRKIGSKVIYGNIDFADVVGFDVYQFLNDTPPESLAGEWTFAAAAFPRAAADDDTFVRQFSRAAEGQWLDVLRTLHPNLDLARLLSAVRLRAVAFVEEMAQRVLALRPGIVGCTSMFQQHCAALALLRRIKELAPDVVTMLGGANCEGIMGQTAHQEFSWLDFVVSGEADAFFGELCHRILNEGPRVPRDELPEGVFGPVHRVRASGKARSLTVHNADHPPSPARAVVYSLDDTAVPDYTDYFESLSGATFAHHLKPTLLFESSRGCWWGMKHHCTFCGLNGEGMTFRSKSAPRILEELSLLRERHDIRWLSAVDNIIDMRHVKTVLPTMATWDETPYLFYEVKANLRKEQLRTMRDAGVRRIQPGIENLHDEVLRLLNKGNSWFINLQLLKWSQELGIRVVWNFLVGAPGERDEWYQELADWLPAVYHLEPPGGHLNPIRYDRFSPYHASASRYGLSLTPYPSYAQVYPLRAEVLDNLAYFFEDTLQPRSAQQSAGHQAVAKRLEEWNRAFYGVTSGCGARLLAEDLGDRVIIDDTRPGASAPRLVLGAMDYRVWKGCESARTRDELLNWLRSAGETTVPLTEVVSAIERLKRLRILLDWRGHLLSLSVNAPVAPYLTPDEDLGYSDLGKLLSAWAKRSVARQCVRLPGESSLDDLTTPVLEEATSGPEGGVGAIELS